MVIHRELYDVEKIRIIWGHVYLSAFAEKTTKEVLSFLKQFIIFSISIS